MARKAGDGAAQVLHLIVSAQHLRGGVEAGASPHAPSERVNPICLLFDSSGQKLANTEWQEGTTDPAFSTVLSVVANEDDDVFHLQLKHVDDPFWDSASQDSADQIAAMPLLGFASFTAEEARRSAMPPARPLALSLSTHVLRHDREGAWACSATVRVLPASNNGPQFTNESSLQHSRCNFLFGCGPATDELYVCEHMLSSRYGYHVPRSLLRMLHHDATRRAAARAQPHGPVPAAAATDATEDAGACVHVASVRPKLAAWYAFGRRAGTFEAP